ncbi:MAG: Bor family protein [Fermentimonas sp.]
MESLSYWGGLAPVEVSDPAVLANGAKDYTVKTEMSFVNGLVSFLTSGIYAPTTTTIYK